MTETTWLEIFDPRKMLEFLPRTGRLTDRKLRLFAVTCCRHIAHLIPDERSCRAVEVAEMYADGQATQDALDVARAEAEAACDGIAARIPAEDNYAAYDGDAAAAADHEYCLYPSADYPVSAA